MRLLSFAAGLTLPLLALAQGPTGIVLAPGGAVVNEPVKVVIDFAAAQRWCGLRVDFGDGDVSDVLVEDFPLTIVRRYANPGRYVVRAEGRLLWRGMASSPGCTGAKRSAVIVVAGSEDRDERRQNRQDRDDRGDRENRGDRKHDKDWKDWKDRKGDKERGKDKEKDKDKDKDEDREYGEDRERSPQNERPERGSRSARIPDADLPPVRAPTPAPTRPVREPNAAEPARGPAPRSRPLRDDSLKVF